MIDYGKAEKELIEYLNFDLKVYSVFGPLSSILNALKEKMPSDQQNYKQIEEECIKLARKSFFDHLIFKYTHGAIAQSIFSSVMKKRNNGDLMKEICGNFMDFDEETDKILLEIEIELKNFEKIDQKTLHNEARVILQQTREIYKKAKLVETVGGFQ